MARVQPSTPPFGPIEPKKSVRAVGLNGATPVRSPVLDQVQRIEIAFGDDTLNPEPRYPGYARLGLLLGGSVGIWACLIMGAARLLQR